MKYRIRFWNMIRMEFMNRVTLHCHGFFIQAEWQWFTILAMISWDLVDVNHEGFLRVNTDAADYRHLREICANDQALHFYLAVFAPPAVTVLTGQ